jgi:hypothetical protein
MTPELEAYRAAWIAARIAGAELHEAYEAARRAYQSTSHSKEGKPCPR